MMNSRICIFILLVVVLGTIWIVGTVAAKTTADPQISWSAVGGGGGYIISSDGVYALDFTVGQPVIGEISQTIDSETTKLCAGFWCLPESWRTYWRAFLPITLQD